MINPEPLELESSTDFKPAPDPRPKVPEPLPVRVGAIADVALPAQAGAETEMDRLYVDLLQFVRVPAEDALIYQADNAVVRFSLYESRIVRETYRALQVEVASLADAEKKLVEAEIEFKRQRGLLPGTESLVLLDPSGNWIEIVESRQVR